MRLKTLFTEINLNSEEFKEMELADALYVLADMAEDEKLSEKEMDIVEDMLERLFVEEKDDIPLDDDEDLDEATIVDHSNTAEDRMASFKINNMANRIRTRIYQRRYRRLSHVKMRAKRRALANKRCGKNSSAQVSQPGATTFVCKLKDKYRSKLMKRVAKRYKQR